MKSRAGAIVVGDRKLAVRIADERGGTANVADRIAELKEDRRFRNSVPDPPKVVASDAAQIRENFDRIVRGQVVVHQ